MSDWTTDPVTRRSNSSPEYLRLVTYVEGLIRGDAAALLSGRAGDTARLILSHLAHQHGMRPASEHVALAVWLTPSALRQAFDGDDGDAARWIAAASDDELAEVGDECLSSDVLWGAFRRAVTLAVEARLKPANEGGT